jgi:hypothetical protein
MTAQKMAKRKVMELEASEDEHGIFCGMEGNMLNSG